MIFNQPKDYTLDVDYTDTDKDKEPKRFNYFGLIIAAVIFGAIIFGLTKCSNTLQNVIF